MYITIRQERQEDYIITEHVVKRLLNKQNTATKRNTSLYSDLEDRMHLYLSCL